MVTMTFYLVLLTLIEKKNFQPKIVIIFNFSITNIALGIFTVIMVALFSYKWHKIGVVVPFYLEILELERRELCVVHVFCIFKYSEQL